MWTRLALAGLVVLGLVGCSARDDRQWMKVNTPYTVGEFQRDYAECAPKGKLNDACMRSRGWIDMSSKMEKVPEPPKVYAPTNRPAPR